MIWDLSYTLSTQHGPRIIVVSWVGTTTVCVVGIWILSIVRLVVISVLVRLGIDRIGILAVSASLIIRCPKVLD